MTPWLDGGNDTVEPAASLCLSTTYVRDEECAMPNQSLVKLCETCHRVTMGRSKTRGVRCWARPLEGGPQCGSYEVRVLSVRQLGDLVFETEDANENLWRNVQAQLDEFGEIAKDLQQRMAAQEQELQALRDENGRLRLQLKYGDARYGRR